MKSLLMLDPQKETVRIVTFLKKTFRDQNIPNAVIGLSGGIDSATSLSLLSRALPPENITVIHMPYFDTVSEDIPKILDNTPLSKNLQTISIKPLADQFTKVLKLKPESRRDKIRIGNIMARIRMIILFDYAKKMNALVVGTENRSEHLLSYFTRFGDEASDVEPIQHLFKTQIFELAEYLNVPGEILKKSPSADLWIGQTDEKEFGFTYAEADIVLHLYYDKKKSLSEIKNMGFRNAEKIIQWVKKNNYKHKTPYTLSNYTM